MTDTKNEMNVAVDPRIRRLPDCVEEAHRDTVVLFSLPSHPSTIYVSRLLEGQSDDRFSFLPTVNSVSTMTTMPWRL